MIVWLLIVLIAKIFGTAAGEKIQDSSRTITYQSDNSDEIKSKPEELQQFMREIKDPELQRMMEQAGHAGEGSFSSLSEETTTINGVTHHIRIESKNNETHIECDGQSYTSANAIEDPTLRDRVREMLGGV